MRQIDWMDRIAIAVPGSPFVWAKIAIVAALVSFVGQTVLLVFNTLDKKSHCLSGESATMPLGTPVLKVGEGHQYSNRVLVVSDTVRPLWAWVDSDELLSR